MALVNDQGYWLSSPRESETWGFMLGLLGFGSWLLALAQRRHRQVEAQSAYERRFRHTLENIELAAVALDRSGRTSFCNDHFLKITGWQRDDVVGKGWAEHFVPSEQKDLVSRLLHTMDIPDAFPTRYEGLVQTRDGDRRLIDWNNTLSYDAGGKVIGATGIGEDITEQRQTEEDLRKLYRAVEQSPSIVLITDRQGLIEYVDPKFTEVSGYSFDEVVGHNPRLLKSGETTPQEYADLWATVRSGGEYPSSAPAGAQGRPSGSHPDPAEPHQPGTQPQLESTGWHKGQACGILGVSRPRLRRMIRQYGLVSPTGSNGDEAEDIPLPMNQKD